jgi:hypothetical protein
MLVTYILRMKPAGTFEDVPRGRTHMIKLSVFDFLEIIRTAISTCCDNVKNNKRRYYGFYIKWTHYGEGVVNTLKLFKDRSTKTEPLSTIVHCIRAHNEQVDRIHAACCWQAGNLRSLSMWNNNNYSRLFSVVSQLPRLLRHCVSNQLCC